MPVCLCLYVCLSACLHSRIHRMAGAQILCNVRSMFVVPLSSLITIVTVHKNMHAGRTKLFVQGPAHAPEPCMSRALPTHYNLSRALQFFQGPAHAPELCMSPLPLSKSVCVRSCLPTVGPPARSPPPQGPRSGSGAGATSVYAADICRRRVSASAHVAAPSVRTCMRALRFRRLFEKRSRANPIEIKSGTNHPSTDQVKGFTPHYTTLQYTTIHYTTLHYTTLRYATQHYATLRYCALLCSVPYSILHYSTLNSEL